MFRSFHFEQASNTHYDVCIIGGGITGAGIFLKACQKGLKAIIIDKGDFSSGTSSRSAKMIHGGLRYLQYFQIKMVYEGLHERENLLSLYPHLVKPQPYFMPVYGSWVNKLKFSVGLSGYDALSGKSSMPKHISVPEEEIKKRFKQITHEDLKGGFIYYDARTNDARLTNEVIQQGVELGGTAINYLEAIFFEEEDGEIISLTCKGRLKGWDLEIKAKQYVSATGVWTDELLNKYKPQAKKWMKPSKGIHVVVKGDLLPKDCVLILPTIDGDGRFIWCLPWEDNMNVLGTTDTEYNEGLNEIRSTKEEIDYLLDSVNKHLPGRKLTYDDILSTYAGLRPLLADPDPEEEDNDSSSRSRDYEIWWNNNNFVTIAGGKLTSFLSMAETCLNEIIEKHPGKLNPHIFPKPLAPITKSGHPLFASIRDKYGDNVLLIMDIIKENKSYANPIFPKSNYIIAEIIFFIRYQHAVMLDDILTRRTLLSYSMKDWNEDLINIICDIFKEELDWTEEDKVNQIKNYRKNWDLMHSWA